MSAARTLANFVRALRSADVRVSPGETIDAARTLDLIGYDDRGRLKRALRPVLAKSMAERATYDRLFDLYFTRARPEAESSGGPAEDDQAEAPAGEAPDLLELAESGDEVAIAMALEQAARDVGLEDIRFSTQTAYYAHKMMKAMGVERLEQRLLDALQARGEDGEAEAQALIAARREMQARARGHVEAQFDVFGAGETERFREDYLASKPISDLDRSDLDRMSVLIGKMARRLAVKYARRRRRRNAGQLDLRRTLRTNAGHGGVPFDLSWKQRKRERAKIVAICDVSNSVARYVRFLLLLLHSLREVVPDFAAFAFSARLADVTDWLDTDGFEAAMTRIVREVGMGSTDYGQALSDLKTQHWSCIDRRTTVIVLGDGRSNYGDPRLDLFRELNARAKHTLWLCPEAPALWGTGDSVIPRYAPHCDTLSHVATLRDLERAVDAVLAAYA